VSTSSTKAAFCNAVSRAFCKKPGRWPGFLYF